MSVKTYAPDEVSCILGAAIISGFGDGDFVKITSNVDRFTLNVGSQGDGARTKSSDKSAKIEITVQKTSESNAILQGFLTSDSNTGKGTFPLLVKDNSGKDLHVAETVWVVKQPDAVYGKEAGTVTWMLETDRMNSFLAGN